MLQNYFKIAFRNLWKNKVFSGINIAGLALGIAAFLLILEYVSLERSVDQFHARLPNLYRVLFQNPDGSIYESVPPGVAPAFKQQFAEINDYCRIADDVAQGIVTSGNVATGKSFREANIALVDGSFFTLFSFPVVAGSGVSLRQPNTVALSQTTARKYFGNGKALGQMITLNNQFGKTPYTVTAIYADMAENSSLRYDMLFSLQTLANPANLNGNDWAKLDNLGSGYIETFLNTQNGANVPGLEQKLTVFKKEIQTHATDESLRLQPVKNLHLGASLDDPYPTTGNLKFIYLLSGIAFLILAIAWFNYVNLSTAGSLKRAKEVGVRKVVGAAREQLIGQFLGESLLLNGIGLALGIGLVLLIQQPFNLLIEKDLSLGLLAGKGLGAWGLLALGTGALVSGGYVALALSGYRPTQTLKGVFARSGRGIVLRQSLVVFQFSISVALIAATVVLYRQLQYMQAENLGMNLEQLLVIRGPEVGKDETFAQRNALFEEQVGRMAAVKNYSLSGSVPGNWYNFNVDGVTKPSPRPGDEKKTYGMTFIDSRYLNTYGIGLVAGTNFTPATCEQGWEKSDKVLINEKAVRALGYESAQAAVGKKLLWGRELEIQGVVKDYHHQSLRQAIDPMIFLPRTYSGYLTLRLTSDHMADKVAELEQLYKQNYPGNPFDYFFVDDRYNQQYESEQRSGRLFTAASGLAILIACLGLFGLATFTAEQRTKEVGVRKVLGASVGSIVALLSKDFLKLVLIAVLIGSPIAWYAADRWLESFAYKTTLDWWIFALAGALAALIAFLTIGYQSMKAALTNPVKSLRNE